MMKEEKCNRILLSIRCLVYNHEKFLRKTLDGFVMQKTDFLFEAVVHDDCSTDGSAKIIMEYAEKYPDIIKPIIEEENQYSKHDGSLGRILNKACVGKYIAMCEGDDYWTDPLKLQKQVDFLESHPDYSMCCHNCGLVFDGDYEPCFKAGRIEDRDYLSDEIMEDWIIQTATIVFRREIIEIKHEGIENAIYGDIILFLDCAAKGKVRGMSECMSMYRIHSGGVTSFNHKYFRLNGPGHYKFIRDTYPNVSRKVINPILGFSYFRRSKIESPLSMAFWKDIFMGLRYNWKYPFRYLYRRFVKSLFVNS